MRDAEPVRALEAQPRSARRPACPQFRPVTARWVYPVEGYCVLGAAPGRFMIPSIEEYREFCTTGQSAACPWFQTVPPSRSPRPAPAPVLTGAEDPTAPIPPVLPPPVSR